MKKDKNSYGKELVLDLHECDEKQFNRKTLEKFFKELCDLIDMEKCELFWWDDYDVPEEERETEPHLRGTSAVQFIKTSNITIHTLEILKRVYLNIFSCKDFDDKKAAEFSRVFFKGKIVHQAEIERK